MLRNRYRRITFFFARALLNILLWDLVFSRLGLRRLAHRTRPARLQAIARGFRELAIALGGVMIKVGQFLSARVDVLPEEITTELAGLQDEVPPEPLEAMRAIAEQELEGTLEEVFDQFDPQPLAAASLGQVHRATLKSAEGRNPASTSIRQVVVKIQRPNIEAIIATDLAALRTVGSWVQHFTIVNRRVDVPALLDEFTRVLYEEIDYLAEGRNVETFAANFAGYPGVRVPRVIWEHTTKRVLTLEDVYAIKITDYEAIRQAGINLADVAERLFHTYMKQIFEDGFVHADPHPGNLFVQPRPSPPAEPDTWELTFVDFGMVARVEPGLRKGLRELAIALGSRDTERLMTAYQMLGVLLPTADLELIHQAEEKVLQRFWGKTMSELREISVQEMRELTREFRGLIYSMPFQVPQNMIFLGRTVAILSGMCTGLNPQFNFWESIEPYAQKFITEEAVAGWETWLEEFLALLRTLVITPRKVESMLDRMARGDLEVQVPDIEAAIRRLERTTRRLMGTLIFAAFLMSGVQLYMSGSQILGGILFAAALITLGWVLLARR